MESNRKFGTFVALLRDDKKKLRYHHAICSCTPPSAAPLHLQHRAPPAPLGRVATPGGTNMDENENY